MTRTTSSSWDAWPREVPDPFPEPPPPWWAPPSQPSVRPPVPVVPGSASPARGGADLADRLLERRTVLVGGTLDGPSALAVAGRLLLLDSDGDDRVELHLSAQDGDLPAALMLAETLDLLRVPVRAVTSGSVGGPVLAVLVAATERVSSPHCQFRIGAPRTPAEPAGDLSTAAEEHQRLLDELTRRLAAGTGQPYDRVAQDLRHGRLLTADEAVEYGVVSGLTTTR